MNSASPDQTKSANFNSDLPFSPISSTLLEIAHCITYHPPTMLAVNVSRVSLSYFKPKRQYKTRLHLPIGMEA